ncbi:methylated-DNA--[protein]-cysteine S-methyltransferase [Zavarzinella formosa]|uniref:methylated-DNA--[protein]-cysteine S-methyltransferase n=1 Tax=Zavarzinella formosa TaxID=360055 RepID=UPI0002DE9FAA|nr:methylated-DNA--[protein]-cysteine S-methyltransferase [Zavarzinella formosa]
MPALLEPQTTRLMFVPSPLGDVRITSDGVALTSLYLPGHGRTEATDIEDADDVLQETARQLTAYFAGKLREFDLPLSLAGTPFQQKVWEELTRIPFGETISYAELARRVGNSNAFRAVGLANGRNPVSIIVPCHRVIGSNGKLTGYGGGLPTKEWLLKHEQPK